MICDVIKYVDNIDTKQNVIYINYNNKNKMHIADILNDVIVYSYLVDINKNKTNNLKIDIDEDLY